MASRGGKNRKVDRSSRNKAINEFKKILSDHEIEFTKLILFGSMATEWFDDRSDLDICVVVPNDVKDVKKLQTKLNGLAGRNDLEIDVIATTVKELKQNMISPILHEIRTNGIEI